MSIKLFIDPESKVSAEHYILGFSKDAVQVFVLSNDGLYYLQRKIERYVDGPVFTVLCHFGAAEIPCDSGYEIVAVNTESRPRSPVKELPSGDKVNVRVWRDKV